MGADYTLESSNQERKQRYKVRDGCYRDKDEIGHLGRKLQTKVVLDLVLPPLKTNKQTTNKQALQLKSWMGEDGCSRHKSSTLSHDCSRTASS